MLPKKGMPVIFPSKAWNCCGYIKDTFIKLRLFCKNVLSWSLYSFEIKIAPKVNLQVTKAHMLYNSMFLSHFTLEFVSLYLHELLKQKILYCECFFLEKVSLPPSFKYSSERRQNLTFCDPCINRSVHNSVSVLEKHPCGNMQACEIHSHSFYTLSDLMSPFYKRRLMYV